nr:MAG TPA: Dentin matrix protein 1 (DMP1) [Caudoviricetes sp.]
MTVPFLKLLLLFLWGLSMVQVHALPFLKSYKK